MKKEKLIVIAFVVVVFALAVGLIVFSGKTPDSSAVPIVPTEEKKPVGAEPGGPVLSQKDCVAAGGRVADTTQKETCTADEKVISAVTGFLAPGLCCVAGDTTTSEGKKVLSEQEARALSEQSAVCTKEGAIGDFEVYNSNSKTWWFSILSPRSDCRPACVVFDETKKTEINWRCTGLLVPKGEDISVKCEASRGAWISGANECEGISQSICTELGGVFNECGSACRNDPNAEMCTEQCVQYCSFK